MHAWEGRAFEDIATLCIRRDPRRYPVGCVTGRPGHESPEVLQWFRHVGELAAFLWRMEPQRWGLRLGDLADFKTRIEPIVVRLDVEGTQDGLREAHNSISRPRFEVRWWGSFADLRAARGEWAWGAVERFRASTGNALSPLTEEEVDEFLKFLRDTTGQPTET